MLHVRAAKEPSPCFIPSRKIYDGLHHFLRVDVQQTSEAGTGFFDAGAAALPGGWPDDAMVGSGRTPAGREVAAQGENVDDRHAEGGGQMAGAGVRADKDVHLLDQRGGFT